MYEDSLPLTTSKRFVTLHGIKKPMGKKKMTKTVTQELYYNTKNKTTIIHDYDTQQLPRRRPLGLPCPALSDKLTPLFTDDLMQACMHSMLEIVVKAADDKNYDDEVYRTVNRYMSWAVQIIAIVDTPPEMKSLLRVLTVAASKIEMVTPLKVTDIKMSLLIYKRLESKFVVNHLFKSSSMLKTTALDHIHSIHNDVASRINGGGYFGSSGGGGDVNTSLLLLDLSRCIHTVLLFEASIYWCHSFTSPEWPKVASSIIEASRRIVLQIHCHHRNLDGRWCLGNDVAVTDTRTCLIDFGRHLEEVDANTAAVVILTCFKNALQINKTFRKFTKKLGLMPFLIESAIDDIIDSSALITI